MGWNTEEVYQHLRQFYGAVASGQRAAIAGVMSKVQQFQARAPAIASAPLVTLEVYYFTLCPHCMYFLKLGLAPILEAQLPGNLVQITLLPVYPPLLRFMQNRVACMEHSDCRLALAPLCALRAVPKPAPANSSELLRGARFAACDIGITATTHDRAPGTMKVCADVAALPVDHLQACEAGAQAMDVLSSGRAPLLAAMELLHGKTGFQDPPSMPWVLLNGNLLECEDGKLCTHTRTPSGLQPLPMPATLLDVVCAKLNVQPQGCLKRASLVKQAEERVIQEAGGKAAAQSAVAKAKDCENCAEVDRFHWDRGHDVRHPFFVLTASVVFLAGAMIPLVAVAGRAIRHLQHIGTTSVDATTMEHRPLPQAARLVTRALE